MVTDGPGGVDGVVGVAAVLECRGGARLSRAPTVTATWGSPRSSRM